MNRSIRIAPKMALSGLLLSMILAGCAVGPEYKAPRYQADAVSQCIACHCWSPSFRSSIRSLVDGF